MPTDSAICAGMMLAGVIGITLLSVIGSRGDAARGSAMMTIFMLLEASCSIFLLIATGTYMEDGRRKDAIELRRVKLQKERERKEAERKKRLGIRDPEHVPTT